MFGIWFGGRREGITSFSNVLPVCNRQMKNERKPHSEISEPSSFSCMNLLSKIGNSESPINNNEEEEANTQSTPGTRWRLSI